MDLLKAFLELIVEFFKDKEITEKARALVQISKLPVFGDKGEHVKIFQKALNAVGYKLVTDGHFGAITESTTADYQKSKGLDGSGIVGPKTLALLGLEVKKTEVVAPKKSGIPWFWKAKEDAGKVETDAAFQNKMNPFWSKAGLPQYKGLVGSARAWCALFVLATVSQAGYTYTKGNASAKSWDNWGVAINYKVDGIPQGAVVRINGSADCASWSGNHVTYANGDCSPEDVNKSGATFSGLGGNQGNMVKVSTYSVKNICSVRWPSEATKPIKITASLNCSNGKTADNESTR